MVFVKIKSKFELVCNHNSFVCIKNYLNKCVINLIFETHVSFGAQRINQYNMIKMRKENITI